MQKHSDIHFLHNHEIDKQRWDDCIDTSPNGLIYAKSFYLDNICPGWRALTVEGYEWVFPITHKTKFGISYLYQPPFTQQLGAFAKRGIIVPFTDIIRWLQQHYRFWEINWNYATNSEGIRAPVHITAATNFILNLSKSYESIAANYHKHLKRKLLKSKEFKHKYQSSIDFDKYIDLYSKNYGMRTPHVRPKDYESLKNVSGYAIKQDMLICREVVTEDDELIALALLLHDEKRIYNLINITTEKGRETEANHFLLDAVIREFSGRDLLFDFEGSDLPGVKKFYQYFGAEDQPYYMLRYNNLPWPVNMIKK